MRASDPRLKLIAGLAKVRPPHVYHVWHALDQEGRRFNAEAFALFCELETRHVQAIVAALTERDMLPGGRQKPEQRATRLPDDFTMPDDWIMWAREKRRWSATDAQAEAEQFTAFWQADKRTKISWRKTWQVWVGSSRRPDGDYSPNASPIDRAAHLERTAALYERMGRTAEAAEMRRELVGISGNIIPFRMQG